MKKTLWVLSALALVGLGFAGCGDEECGDGYACDNDEYCDGQCLAGEYCFGEDPDDSDLVICSKCSVDCGVIFGNVCNESAGLCMAQATCPAGTTPSDLGGGMGECKGGDVQVCTSDSNCGAGQICKDGSCVADDGTKTFRYVRIDDVSDPCKKGSDGKCTTEDPGADIDAIVVVKKSGGAMLTADSVIGYQRADGQKGSKDKTMATDPDKVLGNPDSFVDYANSTVGGKCKYYSDAGKSEYTFVSLGGQGGYIEVQMSGAIEQGDKLDILEVGGCEIENSNSSDGKKAIGEAVKVSISASEDGSSWVEIGEKTSGTDNKGLLSFSLDNSSWFK